MDVHPAALAVFVAFVRLNPQVRATDPILRRMLAAYQVLALEVEATDVPGMARTALLVLEPDEAPQPEPAP